MVGEQKDRIGQSKPLFGYITFTLVFLQWIEYLKTTDVLNKYLQLLFRALMDIKSFLLVFFIFLIYFTISYFIIGAHFDSDNNYEDSYDVTHGDFPTVAQFGVKVLQVFRTSMGDLQPPQYTYWT